MTDGIAKDLPLVSTIFRSIDVVGRVRENFLKRKILAFLIDMNRVSASDRKTAMAKLFSGEKERRKFYDLILHVVDELRTDERVHMVASLFIALLTGGLTEGQFRRLCDVVRNVDREHLRILGSLDERRPVLANEAEIGFVTFYALAAPDYTPHGDGHGLRYRRTPLGTAFMDALGTLAAD